MTYTNLLIVKIVYHSGLLTKKVLYSSNFLFLWNVKVIPLGKPSVIKKKLYVSSMTPVELNKFIKQCDNIQNRISSINGESEDEFFNSMVNSKYYSINNFNKLKPDKNSSFGLLHVNIASLNAHIDDLRTVFR